MSFFSKGFCFLMELRGGRWESEARKMILLAWPIILTNFTHIAIYATDTAFISRYSTDDLAAVGLGGSTMWLIMALGSGFGMAAAPMMANAIGHRVNSVRDMRRTVHQTIWASWSYALVVAVLIWNSGSVLLFFNYDPVLVGTMETYVRLVQWTIFPMSAFWVLRFFVTTLGRPRVSLVVTAMGIVVNALGDYALIFGRLGMPEMGVIGAGIASVLSSLFLFSVILIYCVLDREFRRFSLLKGWWRPDWSRFCEIWRLGLPIGATMAMEGVLFSGSVLLVSHLESAVRAAHILVMQVCHISFMVPMGISEAATIRVGLWAGQNDREGVRVAASVGFGLGIFCASIAAMVMIAFPTIVLAPFLDQSKENINDIIELASICLVFGGLFQIVDSIQFIGAGALRGLKDTRMHMIFIMIGHIALAFPTGVILAFWVDMGVLGIWIGFCVGLACVAVMVMWRWTHRDRLQLLERCVERTRRSL